MDVYRKLGCCPHRPFEKCSVFGGKIGKIYGFHPWADVGIGPYERS